MWESLYQSAWHHPGAALVMAAIMAVVLLRRLPFLLAFTLGALLITCADAAVTGGLSKMGAESWAVFPILSFFFVLFGDWRLWLLTEHVRAQGVSAQSMGVHGPPRRSTIAASVWARSLAMALTPSLVVFGLGRAFPAPFEAPRVMYLIYELTFIVLAMTYGVLILAPQLIRRVDPSTRSWALGAVALQSAGYLGWASADLLILAGQDWGHGLRVLPNVVYYAVFIPWVWFTAPAALRQGWTDDARADDAQADHTRGRSRG